jgi:hypothetical protein
MYGALVGCLQEIQPLQQIDIDKRERVGVAAIQTQHTPPIRAYAEFKFVYVLTGISFRIFSLSNSLPNSASNVILTYKKQSFARNAIGSQCS